MTEELRTPDIDSVVIPPAIREIPIERFFTEYLDTRIRIASVNGGVGTVGELLDLGWKGRMHLKHFGRRCEARFQDVLKARLAQEGVSCRRMSDSDRAILSTPRDAPFLVWLGKTIEDWKKQNRRTHEIMLDRLGMSGRPALSLPQIAEKYQISRQRVKQIENYSWRSNSGRDWAKFLMTRLTELLEGNGGVMHLRSLEMVDPWFEGVGDCPDMLDRVLGLLRWPEGKRCFVQRDDGVTAVVAQYAAAYGLERGRSRSLGPERHVPGCPELTVD